MDTTGNGFGLLSFPLFPTSHVINKSELVPFFHSVRGKGKYPPHIKLVVGEEVGGTHTHMCIWWCQPSVLIRLGQNRQGGNFSQTVYPFSFLGVVRLQSSVPYLLSAVSPRRGLRSSLTFPGVEQKFFKILNLLPPLIKSFM